MFQKQCVDIHCPEYYHAVNGQCVPDAIVKHQPRRAFIRRCFQVTRGLENITVEMATFVFLNYLKLKNVNEDTGVPILISNYCNQDVNVEFFCFEFANKIQVPQSINANAGFVIHITDGSDLFYSLTLSIQTYVNIKATYTQCNMNSSSKGAGDSWDVVDTTKATALLAQYVCDIGNGELNPLYTTVLWETLNCEFHIDPLTFDTKGKAHQLLGLSVEVVLSYITSGVSIISLAPTLLFNARYVSKWPLPKRLLYNQIMTLFISHLVTVLSINANDNAILCKASGVLIHYLWLSMYCWTSICAWHMYSVFAIRMKRMRVIDDQTVTILYLRYRLCGYVCPLLLVAPAVILDILQMKHIYGPQICYVSDYESLLFLFVIPIGFSCFFNMLTYFTTTHAIFMNTRNMSVLKYNCVFYMKLFVKMWFMTSLTSVSAFLAIVINNTSTWYFFICVYGVQSIASSILLGFHKDK